MRPLIIAHRGASAYRPEHTLEAKRLAHSMGADYLEQDIVAARDDALIVIHDVHLDRVTDVAAVYPGRARDDGRFYVRDFDLAELRALRVWERLQADGSAVYPDRYPARAGSFGIHTLGEEIELVRELNAASGRQAGIYPEIKRPAWHRDNGVDLAPLVLAELRRCGYSRRDDPVFVQCFDAAEVSRMRRELDCPWRLIQLIGENAWHEADTDYDRLLGEDGLREVAGYADGIGPWIDQLYSIDPVSGQPEGNDIVARAHTQGLAVHPYTFRADDLPKGFATWEQLLAFAVDTLGVDGLFTDFPDSAREFLDDKSR